VALSPERTCDPAFLRRPPAPSPANHDQGILLESLSKSSNAIPAKIQMCFRFEAILLQIRQNLPEPLLEKRHGNARPLQRQLKRHRHCVLQVDARSQISSEGLGNPQSSGCRRFVRKDNVNLKGLKRKARFGLQRYCFVPAVLNGVAVLFVHVPTTQCLYCVNGHKQRINAPLERHKPLMSEKTALDLKSFGRNLSLERISSSVTKITPLHKPPLLRRLIGKRGRLCIDGNLGEVSLRLLRKLKTVSGPGIGHEKLWLGGVRFDLLAQAVDKHAQVFQLIAVIRAPHGL